LCWLRGKLTCGLDYWIGINSLNETSAGVRFRVTGYVLIKENMTQVWRDFGYPDAKQLIEPAPKA